MYKKPPRGGTGLQSAHSIIFFAGAHGALCQAVAMGQLHSVVGKRNLFMEQLQSLMMFYEYPTSVMKLIAILMGGDLHVGSSEE